MDALIATRNFSGAVLVVDHGSVVFDKAYGLADRDAGLANRNATAFRIGTLTRLYIATEIVSLAEKHKLALTNTAEQFAAGAGPITIGDLLRCDDEAATQILGRVLAGAAHESLPDALDGMFSRLWMTGSAVDTGGAGRSVAHAYRGTPPPVVAYSTTRDVLRWTNALFGGDLVSADRRAMLLETWQKLPAKSGEVWQAVSADAAVIVQPDTGRTVIVRSNGGTTMPYAIATQLVVLLLED